LGGHLLNVRNKDARDQNRKRRHFCVHRASFQRTGTLELVLGFKLLADLEVRMRFQIWQIAGSGKNTVDWLIGKALAPIKAKRLPSTDVSEV
jgi:hypothetical protein